MKHLLKFFFHFSIILFGTNKLIAQSIPKIHSHNDYIQTIPFWDAYANGANSIEADIFLIENNLYVAHNEKDIITSRTLEALYLKPLQTALEMSFKKDQELFLLIDVKSEAVSTLNKLITILKTYPTIINNQNIKIIISGNRPNSDTYSKYPPFIFFDYQELSQPISFENKEKVAMVSLDFGKFSKWNGKGRLTHEDYNRVIAVITKAKAMNKPFRFWGTPDSKSSWKTLFDMGIDVINTDTPYKCVNYINSLPNRFVTSTTFSQVYTPSFKTDQKQLPVKNVILLIGDGNGLSQISSAVLSNNGALSLTQLKSMGLIKTQSADDFTTDSAAAGTALATGKKTNNRAIGTDTNGMMLENIVEILYKKGFSTGCITTDEITGATPASFYAHVKDRSETEKISKDLVKSKLNVFIGGGASNFIKTPIDNNFKLLPSILDISTSNNNKIGVFFSEKNVPSVLNGRGNILADATKYSLQYLEKASKPFFLMVEGAQIDSFGHANNTTGIITETIDFDKAISEALKFADANGETLVIITADHETSGFSIPQGNIKDHKIEGSFITHDHTGTMVPLFAYGPQSQTFQGVYENNEVFHKILSLLKI